MKLALLFGSYREPSNGRRLLPYLERLAKAEGFDTVEILDAKAIGLPTIDKKLEEFGDGEAPANMLQTSEKLKSADAYVMIAGEYNASIQPGLKNLMDHFRTEYENKPIGLCCYSPGALGGARVSMQLRPMVANLGMVSIPMVLGVSAIHEVLCEQGELTEGAKLDKMAKPFIKQLKWFSQALAAARG